MRNSTALVHSKTLINLFIKSWFNILMFFCFYKYSYSAETPKFQNSCFLIFHFHFNLNIHAPKTEIIHLHSKIKMFYDKCSSLLWINIYYFCQSAARKTNTMVFSHMSSVCCLSHKSFWFSCAKNTNMLLLYAFCFMFFQIIIHNIFWTVAASQYCKSKKKHIVIILLQI